MSRNPTTRSPADRSKTEANTDSDTHQIIQDVIAFYGDRAPTVVAWIALDAWGQGQKEDYHFWLSIFQRLRN